MLMSQLITLHPFWESQRPSPPLPIRHSLKALITPFRVKSTKKRQRAAWILPVIGCWPCDVITLQPMRKLDGGNKLTLISNIWRKFGGN